LKYENLNTNQITVTIPGACSQKMYFRLKPVMTAPTVKITNLTITGNTVPLQRTLKSVTTTDVNTGSGNPDNPTAVLETEYLLVAQPFNLFDYVLRSDDSDGIVK
jgi:hypothetical protein